MGWETLAFLALNTVKAIGQVKQANQVDSYYRQQAVVAQNQAKLDAEATVKEGDLVAKNKAKEVAYRAARLKSSYLTSGLTLDGTPQNAIDNLYNTGMEDINAQNDIYNTRSKNIITKGDNQYNSLVTQGSIAKTQGRSQAFGTMTSALSGVAWGSVMSGVTEKAAYGLNNAGFGSTAYSMLDK